MSRSRICCYFSFTNPHNPAIIIVRAEETHKNPKNLGNKSTHEGEKEQEDIFTPKNKA